MLILGLLGEPAAIHSMDDSLLSEWKSGWYHNSSAVLLENGEVVAAIEEERLTRNKKSGKFPYQAINFCLKQGGNLKLTDLDLIVFGEEGGKGRYRDSRISISHINELLQCMFNIDTSLATKIRLVEHHIGHAMSAYAPSGFEDALIITADGFGDGISGSVMEGKNGELTRTLRQFSMRESLGGFYTAALKFLGYSLGDEYKMMGLAPYGNPKNLKTTFDALYSLHDNGKFTLNIYDDYEMSEILSEFGKPRLSEKEELSELHKDVAAAMQDAFERIYFHVLSYFRNATGHNKLCLAGGTAQNSVLNGKILASGMFENTYVQPASYDAGIALGAALYIHNKENNGTFEGPEHYYLGTNIPSISLLETEFSAWQDFIEYSYEEDIYSKTALKLAEGAIIGWVQGKSEFGPRALGNRSILADPRPLENKDKVNKSVKNREAYRPFAPAVPIEHANEFFEIQSETTDLSFMTYVVPVKKNKQSLLQAITHIDGTARIQTVSSKLNEPFWSLLKRFGDLTKVPILLNTSFNNNNEPIVDSVKDAIICFLTTDLDYLVIGNFVISKKNISPLLLTNKKIILRSNFMLIQYQKTNTLKTNFQYGIMGPGHKEIPISKSIFLILSQLEESNREAFALMKNDSSYLELGKELNYLWSERVIDVLP